MRSVVFHAVAEKSGLGLRVTEIAIALFSTARLFLKTRDKGDRVAIALIQSQTIKVQANETIAHAGFTAFLAQSGGRDRSSSASGV